MKRAKWIALALVAVIVTACSPTGPLQTVTKGDELANYSFAEPRTFEEGAYEGALLRVVDGVYRIDLDDGTNTIWWGQWGETYDNIIIEADATQTSERPETTYGIMCRVRGSVGQAAAVDPELAAVMADATAEATAEATADPEATVAAEATPDMTAEATAEATPDAEATAEADGASDATPRPAVLEGDGYLFLVQGSGRAAILRARGRDVQPIADWTTSDAVRPPPETNRIRAVCHDTYLALYVNDQLVAEATDDAFRSGQIGLAAAAANRLGVVVEFDNVQVWQAVGN